MGGKSGLVTFTFPPCARRRLLDSMTATSPRAPSAIRHPPTRALTGREGGEQLKEREMGTILFLARQVSQNVVCSYPSAHHTAAATAEGG